MQTATPLRWHGTTSLIDQRALQRVFVPFGNCASIEDLLDALWHLRQRQIVAVGMRIVHRFADTARSAGFESSLDRFSALSRDQRQIFVESPPVRVWLRNVGRLAMGDALESKRSSLRRYLLHFKRLLDAHYDAPATSTRPCAVQRYDVDPLIAEAAPPSFKFEGLSERRLHERERPYSLEFFATALDAALGEIARAWPEMARIFPRFVKTIIHIPELEYRSCSAQRYAGAILISGVDDTLIALEESLVHECGHQILYNVMEMTPLIHDDGTRQYQLPWSGAERDAYGYFHATYIYLLLALFMARAQGVVLGTPAAQSRYGEIMDGLERALPDLYEAEFLTDRGQDFMDALATIANPLLQDRAASRRRWEVFLD